MVCSVVGAQTTVTFTAGTEKGSTNGNGTPDSVSKAGITISCTDAAFATKQYRFYKGSTTTISSTVGNITKIVFTCTGSGNSACGPGNFSKNVAVGSYTFKDKVGTWTGDTDSVTIYASSQVRATTIEVTYTLSDTTAKASADLSFPETSYTAKIGEPFNAPTLTNPHELTVDYTSSNTDVATVDAKTGAVTLVAAGTTTITASSAETDEYAADSASYTLTVTANVTTTGDGTEANPYTVADVIALNAAGELPSDAVSVKGIISEVGDLNKKYDELTYYISDDGTKNSQLEVYQGYGLNGGKFKSANDLQTGWTVVVNGKLTDYKGTLEFSYGSKITSLVKPTGVEAPIISGDEIFYQVAAVSISSDDEGATIYYTTDGSAPTDKSTKYTEPFYITETTTVKAIAYLNGTASKVAEKTFTKTEPITVADALKKDNDTEVIVKGIVANVSDRKGNATYVNYWISDDGTTAEELEVYRGTGLDGVDIKDDDDIARGDTVILQGKLTTYKKTKELAEGSILLSISKPEEKVTVTSAGWATYVTKREAGFPEGLEAYTVSYDTTADKITLNKVTSVPGKTAVVLRANEGVYTLTKANNATAVADNALTYSWSDKTVNTANTIYVLAENNSVIGFWPVEEGTTVAAFKGYLDLGSKSSAKSFFPLDDATGMNSIKAETRGDDVRYNLAGQRVDKNYKGVVIVNGKKLLVK